MQVLKKQGMKFQLGTKVVSSEVTATGVTLTVEPSKGGPAAVIAADVVLVSTGRRPFTKNIGLEALGIETVSERHVCMYGYMYVCTVYIISRAMYACSECTYV